LLFNQAKSGTITIPSTENTYILEFEKTMYDLTIDFDGPISLILFKVKINDGDPIKLYEINPTRFNNIEIYKIEFIKQFTVSDDFDVYYQGFVKS